MVLRGQSASSEDGSAWRQETNSQLKALMAAAGDEEAAMEKLVFASSGQLNVLTSAERAFITEQHLMRANARLQLSSDTATRLLSADDPHDLLQDLCQNVMRHLDCDVFVNSLLGSDGVLRVHACSGVPAAALSQMERLDPICASFGRDWHQVVVADVQQSDQAQPPLGLLRSLGIRAYCSTPLLADGHAFGTLAFGSRRTRAFAPEDLDLIQTITRQMAVAIQKAQARTALVIANARLAESDNRKSEFIGVLSHELRNPLAPIKNCLHIMDHVPPQGEQARKAKATIERQVEQIVRLVDDLLDVTRVARGKVQLEREILDLNEVLRWTVEDHRSVLEAARVQVDVVTQACPVWVDADWQRLAQAIGNVLQNAGKFTLPGGKVTASVEVEGDDATLRIADTGVGMSTDTLRILFEPFVQAETEPDRKNGGLGLGLALVKGLVELHGGTVAAESPGLGGGSEILLRLPLAEPA